MENFCRPNLIISSLEDHFTDDNEGDHLS
jgi:hypothetical protein